MNDTSSSLSGIQEIALPLMFRQPGLDLSRRLRESLDNDPQYLDKHRGEVLAELCRQLARAGLIVDPKKSEDELAHLVREVVVRLRSYEKVEGRRRRLVWMRGLLDGGTERTSVPVVDGAGDACDESPPATQAPRRSWRVSILTTKPEDSHMTRQSNTNVKGEPFDSEIVEMVWQKAPKELWFKLFKRDVCGASIERGEYGKESMYGWEVDHILPVAKGGTDDLSNLQALHWQNNRRKGDDFPKWQCEVRV